WCLNPAMRSVSTTLRRCLGGAMLLLVVGLSPAFAKEIKGLRVATGPTGTRAEILLDTPAAYSLLTLQGPDRLVVDLAGVSLPAHLPLPAGQGIVRSVRTGHPEPGKTRVVFDLAAPVAVLAPRLEPTLDGQRLVLEWPGDGPAMPVAPARDDAAVASAILNGAALPTSPPPATHPAADPAQASAAATERLIASITGAPAATPARPTATTQVQVPVQTQPPPPQPRPQSALPAEPARPLVIAI